MNQRHQFPHKGCELVVQSNLVTRGVPMASDIMLC